MFHKKNLIGAVAGTVFLSSFAATSALATDAAKHSEHHHGHHCEHKMATVDLDKDGKISRDEFIKHHELMFDKKDTNKDGFLDETEMKHMMDHKHESTKDSGHGHGHGGAKH